MHQHTSESVTAVMHADLPGWQGVSWRQCQCLSTAATLQSLLRKQTPSSNLIHMHTQAQRTSCSSVSAAYTQLVLSCVVLPSSNQRQVQDCLHSTKTAAATMQTLGPWVSLGQSPAAQVCAKHCMPPKPSTTRVHVPGRHDCMCSTSCTTCVLIGWARTAGAHSASSSLGASVLQHARGRPCRGVVHKNKGPLACLPRHGLRCSRRWHQVAM